MGKVPEFFYRLAFTFVVFVLFSGLLRQDYELVKNICWALGFTVLFTIRDSLTPKKQRIANLAIYGLGIVLPIVIALFKFSTLTISDTSALILLFGFSAISFAQAYVLKAE
jgi:hypothetical protein